MHLGGHIQNWESIGKYIDIIIYHHVARKARNDHTVIAVILVGAACFKNGLMNKLVLLNVRVYFGRQLLNQGGFSFHGLSQKSAFANPSVAACLIWASRRWISKHVKIQPFARFELLDDEFLNTFKPSNSTAHTDWAYTTWAKIWLLRITPQPFAWFEPIDNEFLTKRLKTQTFKHSNLNTTQLMQLEFTFRSHMYLPGPAPIWKMLMVCK